MRFVPTVIQRDGLRPIQSYINAFDARFCIEEYGSGIFRIRVVVPTDNGNWECYLGQNLLPIEAETFEEADQLLHATLMNLE